MYDLAMALVLVDGGAGGVAGAAAFTNKEHH